MNYGLFLLEKALDNIFGVHFLLLLGLLLEVLPEPLLLLSVAPHRGDRLPQHVDVAVDVL